MNKNKRFLASPLSAKLKRRVDKSSVFNLALNGLAKNLLYIILY